MTDFKQRSGAGDEIRQGRAGSAAIMPGSIELAFEARQDGRTYVMLKRAEVGVICKQQAERGLREGFNWLSFLPEQHSKPKFAETLAKAKDALRSVTETWCEAAGLVARPNHPHHRRGNVTAWRGEENR